MIIDAFENLGKYKDLLPNLTVALEKMNSMKNGEVGEKYAFSGGYVFFQEGMTKPLAEAQFETHQKYVDVQVVLEGSEYLAWNKIDDLIENAPYQPEKDVQKFLGENLYTMKISSGMVYICFPWDGHQAVFHLGEESLPYKKAIIKLEITP